METTKQANGAYFDKRISALKGAGDVSGAIDVAKAAIVSMAKEGDRAGVRRFADIARELYREKYLDGALPFDYFKKGEAETAFEAGLLFSRQQGLDLLTNFFIDGRITIFSKEIKYHIDHNDDLHSALVAKSAGKFSIENGHNATGTKMLRLSLSHLNNYISSISRNDAYALSFFESSVERSEVVLMLGSERQEYEGSLRSAISHGRRYLKLATEKKEVINVAKASQTMANLFHELGENENFVKFSKVAVVNYLVFINSEIERGGHFRAATVSMETSQLADGIGLSGLGKQLLSLSLECFEKDIRGSMEKNQYYAAAVAASEARSVAKKMGDKMKENELLELSLHNYIEYMHKDLYGKEAYVIADIIAKSAINIARTLGKPDEVVRIKERLDGIKGLARG